ncbi:MAG TPA: NUDIX domain-containing protein [Anaerolineae bacterium]
MSTLFSIGVFAILFDESGRVLLCHRRDMDVWNLPGGGAASREMPTETAIRETREETGLDVVTVRLVGVYSKSDKDELVFTFHCRPIGGELTTSNETDACQYFAIADIPANTLPKHVERIHDALNSEASPIFHRQTLPSMKEFLQRL